jgi:recombination protein RecT
MASNAEIQLARKNIIGLLESQKAQITMALPKHLTADRLCRVAVTEMSKNPKLFECNPTSILASIITAAQLGLEVGVNGQAYLVPYSGVCQLIPGWQGYVDLVSRAGRASVWTGAVRSGDFFKYQLGSSPKLEHTPGDEDGGNFTHVYAVGWIKDSQWPVIEVWSRAKVQKHLSQYNKVGNRHYALQNENNLEMYGRKVALLQVVKYMPKSIEMQQAQRLDISANDGVQSLTLGSSGVIEGEYVDISQDAKSDIDGSHNRTDAVKAAVRHASKDKAQAQDQQKSSQPQGGQQMEKPQPEKSSQPAEQFGPGPGEVASEDGNLW